MSTVLPFVLFLYQYLVWQLEVGNFTTHSHHRELFGTNYFFLIVQVNSLPHLAAAYVFYHQMKWPMVLYLPYLFIFTIGQIFTWWIPYFFRKGLWYIDDNGEKLRQYHQYHSHHHRILPQFRDHPVIPDTEHTILLVLTCLTVISSIRAIIHRFRRENPRRKKIQ